ncbi:MAG: hypothetical protein JNJ65_02060 [Cyclobacteriaceae bacterium]|nr:hypothetical protein [Cyclobacteriaceae bacterium]
MSSHHVVRENQEPALVILNTNALAFEKAQELLEWMPTVVVLASEVESVLGWGIKVDVVLSPLEDRETWVTRLADQTPIKILTYPPADKPLLTALCYLVAIKSHAVNVLCMHPDDFGIAETFPSLDIEMFMEGRRWSWIKSGKWEKWLPAHTILYLLPEVQWKDFPHFSSGRYVIKNDGFIELRSTNAFWIGEDLT